VIRSGGSYTAFPETGDQFTTSDPGQAGIVGGADNPDVTSDDFTTSLTLQDGRLVGTVEGLVSSHEECPDGPNTCQTVTNKSRP
jgi:hypothetical protein